MCSLTERVGQLLHLIRYRFLLFAGLLPYFLGAAISYDYLGDFNLGLFLTGLIGLFFVLIGVEAFNEYFDWIQGTDRVFQLDPKPITKKKFYVGIGAFFVALLFAVYLTIKMGPGIFIFAVTGFIAAAGYLGPPIKFTYRGMGELVIASAYGPFMVAGSFYLQTGTVSVTSFIVSIIPAICLFQIAIMNEVPDFLQDRLVGKKNLCVRLGTEKIVRLYGFLSILFFVISLLGLLTGVFPRTIWPMFLLAPLSYYIIKIARESNTAPIKFLPAIRGVIIFYIIAMIIFISGFLL